MNKLFKKNVFRIMNFILIKYCLNLKDKIILKLNIYKLSNITDFSNSIINSNNVIKHF